MNTLHQQLHSRRLVHSAAHNRRPVSGYVFTGSAAVALLLAVVYFKSSNKPPPLEPFRFTATTLVSSESGKDPNYKSIELQLPLAAHPTSFPKPIWSTYIKDHDIQIERPFTPLNLFDGSGRLKYWVKRYDHGEMGRWLTTQPVGQSIELRGPVQTLDWAQEHGKWDHVLMISGGTGITPFVQLIRHLAQDPPAGQLFTLLHSSPTPDALPPAEVLTPLMKLSSNPSENWFNAQLFVDSVGSPTTTTHLGQVLQVHRIGSKDIERALQAGISHAPDSVPSSDLEKSRGVKTLILICGPESMIKVIAGPRTSEQDPGPVSGILKSLGFDRTNVRKL